MEGKPEEYQVNEEEFQELLEDVIQANLLIMEIEAKEFRQNVLFPYVFGRPAPQILDPEVTIPDDHHEKLEEYRELAIKVASEKASLLEKVRYRYLKRNYFDKLNRPASVRNPDYKRQPEPEDSE